jgi:hypothetical protein
MDTGQLPPIEKLREYFNCIPDKGLFTWIKTNTNRISVGDVAGYVQTDGRRRVRLEGILYLNARLIWLWVHGEPVPHEIDHKDANKSNDAIGNLRDATRAQNVANNKIKANNTSGYKGVSYDKSRNKFEAYVTFNQKKRLLGRYDTAEEAAKVRQAAFEKLFGEYARHQ